ncbi:phosphoglycerate dehydrogenase [Agarilytica rhodophyticola]|uniref:phosphoglycerate dehydrogenase n=1 Tax=Agarilytica rhodophyticola TaxID=1737490 RepID=UPI000B342CAD|nr:phosphoglycerate dehydrogenase [Agarilytica rhodophyticola]
MNLARTSLEKDKIKFVLLEGVHQSAVDSLTHAGYRNVDYVSTALTGDELKERIKDAHFVGIRSRTQLTSDVFEAANKLIAVGCFCIGTNQVDLKAAQEKGVVVFNAPFSNTRSVAELVIAQAILLLRDIPSKNAGCHRGEWKKSAQGSYEIRGKTLGLIGYGSIGSQISVLAESLGMTIIFYDVVTKLTMGNAIQCKSLNELLAKADIVSLHVPETPDTKNMISERELASMKQGAVLINASRGTVIDIDALAQALESGHLAGAAIDVFPKEPKSNNETFESPLKQFDNVILTPHIGGSTMEAQENIGYEVAEKLIKYSDNGTTLSSVNFPEVALPTHRNVHRLLHVHKNIPGVLTAINQILSENNINICGQYLQTNDKVGYVVIDIDSQYSETAQKHLKEVNGTIRCRVLY